MTQYTLTVDGDKAILTRDGTVVYTAGSIVPPERPPVVPPEKPPVVTPPRPDFPLGAVLAEGTSAWFRENADFFVIDNPSYTGTLEIALANLNDVTNVSVLRPDGSVIGPQQMIGGGSCYVRNADAGQYRIRVESPGIGVIKFWRR